MRFPGWRDLASLPKLWAAMVQQHEKDFEALKPKLQDVTLTANVATTNLANFALRPTSVVLLMPMTANAAAALATTYISQPTQGAATINHANNAQVDRTFRAVVLGT